MIKGFTCGAFDFLHAGHVKLLGFCKNNCDYLVVGLHVSPDRERGDKHKPIMTVSERYIQLMACRYVDEVIPYETESELVDLIRLINPDVRILGSDYKGSVFTGAELPIRVLYSPRSHRLSSSAIRRRL